MNILVTGGSGQLGRDCAQVLQPVATVHALASSQLDITDRNEVREAFARLCPNVVINCAAYTKVDQCETETERCFLVNRVGPELLARQCLRHGCRLIHISTDYVFSGSRPASEPYDEEDPVGPLSAYGRSKLEGEEAVRSILDDHLIIRTAWLYGMGGDNFLKTMLRLVLTDPERPYKVVNDQYGSLTWTWRLARQIRLLLDVPMTGVVHASAGGRCTWYQGAKFFLETMQVAHNLQPCTTKEYPVAAPRPHNSLLANRRLQTAGLDIMPDWKEDIIRFVHRFGNELLDTVSGRAPGASPG